MKTSTLNFLRQKPAMQLRQDLIKKGLELQAAEVGKTGTWIADAVVAYREPLKTVEIKGKAAMVSQSPGSLCMYTHGNSKFSAMRRIIKEYLPAAAKK